MKQAKTGQIIGIDAEKRLIWNVEAKYHKLMMPRLLNVNSDRVGIRGLILVKNDGTIDLAPAKISEVESGTVLAVAAVNGLSHTVPGWYFRGWQNEASGTSGRCFLFGVTPDGAVTDCPKDKGWVQRFVEFYDGSPE